MLPTESITQLPGIGPEIAKKLRSIDILSIQDLLLHFPTRYLDFTQFSNIRDLKPGEVVTIRGTLKSIQARFSFKTRTQLTEGILSDATGSIKITWFNQGYIAKQLTVGEELLLSGKVDYYKGLQITNPVHEKVQEYTIHTGRLVPVYRLPEGIYNKTFRKYIQTALSEITELTDIIPNAIQKKYLLPDFTTSVRELHFPSNNESLQKVRRRMIFAEVMAQQIAVLLHKKQLAKFAAPKITIDIALIKKLLKTLPFTLTTAQKQALWHICTDLEHKHPMNRLVQGDVGSGKTLVALLASYIVSLQGFQIVLLAPTEILAQQHNYSFINYIQKFNALTKNKTSVALYTRTFQTVNNMATPKKELLKKIAEGTIRIIIGTHATLQDAVTFHKLALVIVDEQHRFGVEQRSKLLDLKKHSWSPHLLSMSATPIPRTLALSMFADLEISTLLELPKGRQEITTQLFQEHQREHVYSFIKKELEQGRQAFIVTPLVEESATELKSVKEESKRLAQEVFPEYNVGLLYGSMKGGEKEKIMAAFKERHIDILVATSVIEIGIDIPNATVIVIENAERFGLAQLHQLRGRVGRGEYKSYCFLLSANENEATKKRLSFFTSCSDGFTLAKMDMQQRGFGTLFGKDQTGFTFVFNQFLTPKILAQCKAAAEDILQEDPILSKSTPLKNIVLPIMEQLHLE